MAKKIDKTIQHRLVALDIGTSKIVAMVGEISNDNTVEIVGYGIHTSRGLKRGVVVDIESTTLAIQRATEEAALMSDCKIESVWAGIAGNHIQSLNSHGVAAIRHDEVSQADVDRVIESAKAVSIPANQETIHVIPQEFIIDDQDGIRFPIGMTGVRLAAKVHLITGATSAKQNITKCVKKCGLEVHEIVLEQVASSEAVLTDDEKELGICMVDIGGGTTDIAVFNNGEIQHTAVIPIAGDQVTNDIAVGLKTPIPNAEEIKIRYACALTQLTNHEDTIEVPGVGDRPPRRLSRQILSEVVQMRYEELFTFIQSELRRSGYENLIAAGIVLTGGSSKMEGVIELAEEIFHMPVRLGIPQFVSGLAENVKSPIYATSVGLLLHAHKQVQDSMTGIDVNSGVKGIWGRIKSWYQGHF